MSTLVNLDVTMRRCSVGLDEGMRGVHTLGLLVKAKGLGIVLIFILNCNIQIVLYSCHNYIFLNTQQYALASHDIGMLIIVSFLNSGSSFG